jgi:hypothetical protein
MQRARMQRSSVTLSIVLAACAGFLLGVLWMDLMFDALALGASGTIPETSLATIAGYYRRVTTDAAPRGALIAAVMLIAVGGTLWQAIWTRGWRSAIAVPLITIPVALALARIVPDAVRLGARSDSADVQALIARSIAWAHVACVLAVAVFLVLEIVIARRSMTTGR